MSGARSYYEANTRRFLRWGEGGRGGAIHRALWAPGVHTREDAFAWAHRRAWRARPEIPDQPTRVLDLGCGVGAALVDLASDHDLAGVGVSISPTQVEAARARARAAGVEDRVEFACGDFCDLGSTLSGGRSAFTLAYAIEAFVHAADPAAFFAQVAGRLRPGGRLVIIDDVRSEKMATERERDWLERFVGGWHVQSLLTRAQIDALAESAGLMRIADEKLTAFVMLGRPRDRAIRRLTDGLGPVRGARAAMLRRQGGRGVLASLAHAWENFDGGDALQRCLAAGLIDYRCLVFERRGEGA